MKRTNTINIVLGIIAAEVVFQTMRAFADRPVAVSESLPRADRPQLQYAAKRFILWEALSHAAGLLRKLFSGTEAVYTRGNQLGPGRVQFLPVEDAERENVGKQRSVSGVPDRGVHQTVTEPHAKGEIPLKGSMEGIAEKLKDPAWAGVLAANHGNVSLTDAERAVPMPNPGQFVQRLDKNPFIGQGMKDHSRDKI